MDLWIAWTHFSGRCLHELRTTGVNKPWRTTDDTHTHYRSSKFCLSEVQPLFELLGSFWNSPLFLSDLHYTLTPRVFDKIKWLLKLIVRWMSGIIHSNKWTFYFCENCIISTPLRFHILPKQHTGLVRKIPVFAVVKVSHVNKLEHSRDVDHVVSRYL